MIAGFDFSDLSGGMGIVFKSNLKEQSCCFDCRAWFIFGWLVLIGLGGFLAVD